MNKTQISASIVADSITKQGERLISAELVFPRFLLAEFNKHRMLSSNTSSSRAIPFEKMVEVVKNDPFIPIAWQKNHKGMQGTEYEDRDWRVTQIRDEWLAARNNAIESATELNKGVTKQLCNRLLEPFMWCKVLATGNIESWNHLFDLRCPQYSIESLIDEDKRLFKSKKDLLKELDYDPFFPDTNLDWLSINKGQAEIHFMDLAEKMYDAVNESTPKQLKAGEWHIPFGNKIPPLGFLINKGLVSNGNSLTRVKISTAMAANTSYTTVGNEPVKSYEKWIELHDNKLIAYDPPHSSPMEHCARAMDNKEYSSFIKGNLDSEIDEDGFIDISTHINNHNSFGWCYNLKGFIPYRYYIDNNLKIE